MCTPSDVTVCLLYYYAAIGYWFRLQKAVTRPVFTKKKT